MITANYRKLAKAAVVGLVLCCGWTIASLAWGQEGLSSSPPESASAAAAGSTLATEQPCPVGDPCHCLCHHGHQGCLARYMSAVGGFNCSCRGSYKFPVPPQYTYHWPGLYSQQLMTSYQSPYRYPLLKLPPWMEKRPNADVPQNGALMPLMPSPGEKHAPSNSGG
ncbi:MAG: hypothetical protein WBH86_11250 [Thermogutta sp.]|nr:hypothetical protein [Thermogutta sp.]HOP78395.1 hypothetical protein [Thermogutta sp.]HPU06699.1 hypothetical protein [Thermogutta sp.]HQF12328.1 hypothetical protein [Thermogutta sp.]